MGSVISVFYVLLTVGKRVWGMRGWGGGVGLGGENLWNCEIVCVLRPEQIYCTGRGNRFDRLGSSRLYMSVKL